MSTTWSQSEFYKEQSLLSHHQTCKHHQTSLKTTAKAEAGKVLLRSLKVFNLIKLLVLNRKHDPSPCLHICASTQCKKHRNSGYHLPKLASHFPRVGFANGLVNGFQGHGADEIRQPVHASNFNQGIMGDFQNTCRVCLVFPKRNWNWMGLLSVQCHHRMKEERTYIRCDLNSSTVSEHLPGGLLLDQLTLHGVGCHVNIR